MVPWEAKNSDVILINMIACISLEEANYEVIFLCELL